MQWADPFDAALGGAKWGRVTGRSSADDRSLLDLSALARDPLSTTCTTWELAFVICISYSRA